jgi:hypothetical protein
MEKIPRDVGMINSAITPYRGIVGRKDSQATRSTCKLLVVQKICGLTLTNVTRA